MSLEVDLLKISDLSIGEVCKPCDDGKVLEKVDVGRGKNISLKIVKKKKVGEEVKDEKENLLEVGEVNVGEEVKKKEKKNHSVKCDHGKNRYYCIICTPSSFCKHSRRKSICLECGTGNQVCIHKNIKTSCVLCCGGTTCPHKSRKSTCSICFPENYCIHNKFKKRCVLCFGTHYCTHGKRKDICKNKECKAGSICEHGNRRNICRSCEGSQICLHNKIRSSCYDCFKICVCKHEILKSDCDECCPANFKKCEHNIYKSGCKKCNSEKLCIHENWKNFCKQCTNAKYICIHWKHRGNCIECGKVEICPHDIRKEICIPCKGSRVCCHNKLKHRCKSCEGRSLCKSEFCETTGNKKYDGYCVHCYIHLFPDKKLSNNYRSKELCVVDFVKEKFPGLDWICNKKVYDGCSKRKPDMFLDLGYQVIVVEIDENQHKAYDCSCENMRLMEISQDINHRPLIFIRFNPDTYYQGEKMIESCWVINKKGICTVKHKKKKEWEERLDSLTEMIEYWLNEENQSEKTVEVIQLFYDS